MKVYSEMEILKTRLWYAGVIVLAPSFLVFLMFILSLRVNQLPIRGYYVPEESASICMLASEEFSIRDEVLFFDDKSKTMSDNDRVCTVKMVQNIRNDDCIGSKLYQIKWDCEGVGDKGDQSMVVNISNTSDKVLINKKKYIRCNR